MKFGCVALVSVPDVSSLLVLLYALSSATAAPLSGPMRPAAHLAGGTRAASFIRTHAFPIVLACILLLQVVSLWHFAGGFFLTRYELPDAQTCSVSDLHGFNGVEERSTSKQQPPLNSSSPPVSLSSGNCWSHREYDRVIVLLVDALRFDFLVHNDTVRADDLTRPPYVNGLPIVSSLLSSSVDSRHTSLFRFVADPPTVTMQRLKSLTTGGMPTFIDIKDNFGGSAITEDNWIKQLAGTQRVRSATSGVSTAPSSPSANVIHFFGDDTWFDLYPPTAHFSAASRAYPSFNVKDLHTVDDGCRANLEPRLAREMRRLERQALAAPRSDDNEPSADEWDVLIAHFLGVDHVGHRYGPNHDEMRTKLAQMNEVLAQNVAFVRRQREVNTILRKRGTTSSAQVDGSRPQEVLLVVLGDHGMTMDGNHGGQTPEEIYSGIFLYSTKRISQGGGGSTTPTTRTRGDEGRVLEEIRGRVVSDHALSDADPLNAATQKRAAAAPFVLPPLSPHLTSFLSIPQIDFVPTISLLLGLPIPFGSLGKIIPELFWGRDDDEGPEEAEDATAARYGMSADDHKRRILVDRIVSFLPLIRALRVNALQVRQYLRVYAARGGATFGPDLANNLFDSAERAWRTDLIDLTPSQARVTLDLESARRLERVCVRVAREYYAYLHACAEAARSRWTTFDLPAMHRGLTLAIAATLALAGAMWSTRLHDTAAQRRTVVGSQDASKVEAAHPMHAVARVLLPIILCGGTGTLVLALLFGESISALFAWLSGLVACGAAIVVSVQTLLRSRHSTPRPAFGTSRVASSWLCRWRLSFPSYVSVIALALYAQGQFSGVFIENEGTLALYAAAAIAASWMPRDTRRPRARGEDKDDDDVQVEGAVKKTGSSHTSLRRFGWLVLLLASLRLMSFASHGASPDGSYRDASHSPFQTCLMASTLVLLPLISVGVARSLRRRLAPDTAATSPVRLTAFVHDLAVPLAHMLLLAFWSLPSTPLPTDPNAPDPTWMVRIALPRGVYAITLVGLALTLVAWPRAVPRALDADGSVREDSSSPSQSYESDADVVSNAAHMSRRRRDVFDTPPVSPKKAPRPTSEFTSLLLPSADDHATLLALQCHSLLTVVSLPLLLVWGPKSSVVLLSVWSTLLAVLRLTSGSGGGGTRTLSFSHVLFFSFLALHLFAATGHNATFSSLQVSCAFIGFDVFHFWIGGALLALNTFGHLLLTVTAAMFTAAVMQMMDRRRTSGSGEKRRCTSAAAAQENGSRSDDTSSDEDTSDHDALLPASSSSGPAVILPFHRPLLSSLFLLSSIRALLSTLNVYVQRRHLFVWAIFAPKFLFDAIAHIVLGVAVLLAAAAAERGRSAQR